jgi:hypothetical protein
MSVGFTNAVVEGLRYNKVPVAFQAGWATRGNGYEFVNGRPEGLIVHHTGSAYDTGLSILVNGRSDLDPPLCNSCTHADGTIRIIAAHPANHAGPAGGPSLGPFTKGGLFNPRVWGNEVMYPGTQPWTPAQYRSVRILGGVICGILGYRDTEHIRGHFETNGIGWAGKWDPGAGNGSVSFPMNKFRSEVWSALSSTLEEAMVWPPLQLSGQGRKIIPIPVGSADGFSQRRAFLSIAALDVSGSVHVEIFAQSDTDGIEHWTWTDTDLKQNSKNVYKRVGRELKSGTTKLILNWDLRNAVDAEITVETKPTV